MNKEQKLEETYFISLPSFVVDSETKHKAI